MKRIKLSQLKKKITNLKNDYPIFVFFVISHFINAVLVRVLTTKVFMPRSIFMDLTVVFFLGLFGKKFDKKGKKIYYGIVSFLLVVTCIANSMYYNYYGSFVSVSLLATSVFVSDVGDAVVTFALKPTDWIYLWQLIVLVLMFRKKKEEKLNNNKSLLRDLEIAVLLCCFSLLLPKYASLSGLVKMWNRVSVVNNFGVYVYQVDDIVQSLKPKFNNIFGYDYALKKTQEFYDENSRVQSVNEYTNIFEGKNVIVIHAESLQAFNLGLEFEGKEVTPNLNKLIKKSIYFSNFYAQVGVGTSSDTEFTYSTSLLPANNGTVFVNYYNDKFVTIQQLLHNNGYYVFSMHGNDGDFWNRNAMHLNMGYDKFYSKSSFEVDEEYGLGLSDKSFFRQVVPMIKEINEEINKPYYGTLITLTNHTPWKDANEFSDYKVTKTVNINGEIVTRNYLEGTSMGNYIKSVNYMDKAIGEFIDEMELTGLMDNTVLVIYGDHDARLPKSQYDYMYNYDAGADRVLQSGDDGYIEFNDYDYELNRSVPFIIYSNDLPSAVEIDTPMGMIDVLPTLGNMLGVYSKYSLGQDIMSIKKEDGIVVFKDASYITDKLYYSTKNEEAYAFSKNGNVSIADDYITKKSEYASKINEISDNIITYDLIKDLK